MRHLKFRRARDATATWQRCLVFFGVSLAVAACGGEPTTAAEPGPTILVPQQGPGDVSTSAAEPGPTIFFPQQKAVDGEREVMDALLIGKLVVVEGCLRVNTSYSDTGYLLVWPPDFRLSTENDTIQVLNGAGQVVARVGDEVDIGGGEVRYLERLDEYVRQQLPPDCSGTYWIVGDVDNPAEATSESGPTIFFPQQPPVEGEREMMTAMIGGQLRLGDGCLRAGAGHLLVWPPGWSLSTENDRIEILNGTGQVVARVGEEVRMSGGEVPFIEGAARTQLKIPADCPGRYWIVGDVVSARPRGEPEVLSAE